MDGRYFLTASWRVAPESPVAETTMVLARNTQSVILGEKPLTLTPGSFEISLDLVAGETVVLSAIAGGSTSVTVGVDFFITGPLF